MEYLGGERVKGLRLSPFMGIVSVKDKQGHSIKDYHRILPYQATVVVKLHYLFIFIGIANIEYT